MAFTLEHLEPGTRHVKRLAYIIWKSFGQHTIKIASGKDDYQQDGLVFRRQRLEIELQNPLARAMIIRRTSSADAEQTGLLDDDEGIVATLIYRLPRCMVDLDTQRAWDKVEPPQPGPPPRQIVCQELLSDVRAVLNGMKGRGLDEGKDFYLSYLAILPGYQNRGLGQQLMREFHTLTDAQQATSFVTTGTAKTFYEKFGWTVVEQAEVSWEESEDGAFQAGSQELYGMRRLPSVSEQHE